MGPRARESAGRWVILFVVLTVVCPTVAASDSTDTSAIFEGAPFPFNERLSYAVSWAGIHCGEMEITSFRERDDQGDFTYRIVVLMRTTRFFDGIYRVRSRLDSYLDPKLMSSVRYEERSHEKKKRKEDLWVVDLEGNEVVRTKNGDETRIPIEVDRAFDPLAFIFRLRTMDARVGEEAVLELMTSKGAVETVARATERKEVRTKMGKRDAVAVVPEPKDEMMFSKSGAMVVWIERARPHRPCRIEFDLSFGKLVASLRGFESIDDDHVIADWKTWGDKGQGSR